MSQNSVPTFRRTAVYILLTVATITLMAGCLKPDTPSADLVRKPVTMEKLTYPDSRIVDQVDTYHGTDVTDPYRWLEDADSEETAAWVTAQNKVTAAYLADSPVRQTYVDRLTEIWDYTRYGSPAKHGKYTFFFKNDGLQNQSVLYVQDDTDSKPRVLLDPNTLSEDGTIALANKSFSKDGHYLAWAASVSGSDWQTWHIRDVATGKDLDDEVKWTKFTDAAWDPAGDGFYYSRYDAPKDGETFEGTNYYQKLFYHKRGTAQDQDVLVYERPDEKEWGFEGDVSQDGRYLIVSVWMGTSHNRRVFYRDLQGDTQDFTPLLGKNDAKYVFLDNDGPVFYFLTNYEAPRERIIAIDTAQPEVGNWREIVPENVDTVDGVDVLNNSFVVTYMHDVANVVKIFDRQGQFVREIELPGLGSVGGFHGERAATETYYSFNSYLNPSEIYHYDMVSGQSTLFRAPEIKFDFSAYTTERVFYKSKDGTLVPLFLVHRKDLKLDGNNPTILYGYGGFNISMNPSFSIRTLPWIENGGIFATACLRGGGEYGERWHEEGMLDKKQNVFDDFIAAGEYLINEGYTNANRLSVYGGSNGGTLVGAVINQRPELFGAAVPAVGVMDMLRFQHFTIGWAWTSDYGSSEDPDMFPTLYGYSPYHNLKPGVEYPAVMVMTADHDDRVVPGHSFKYTAQLQACQGGNLPALIRIQTKAGHGAGKPTAMVIQEVADRYAFLHKALGLDTP